MTSLVDILSTATHPTDQLPPAICSSASATFTNSISKHSALQAFSSWILQYKKYSSKTEALVHFLWQYW
jgi:hypothetical protein